MGWRVWGDSYSTAALTDKSMYQQVTFQNNYIIRGVRTWLVVYNDPAFTSINMKVYSNEGGLPRKLLYTSSNVLLKADVHTLANGVKEVYFDFDNASFRSGDSYHFVINAVGYTGSDTSHLAWMKAFPDPVYQTGLTISFSGLLTFPYQIYFIGSEL